jgi:hypothetical protein
MYKNKCPYCKAVYATTYRKQKYCGLSCSAKARIERIGTASQIRLSRGLRGWNYKDGTTLSVKGYRLLYLPKHPMASKKNGLVLEHRVVMAKKMGRILRSDELVHHINGDRLDNRVRNLRLLSRSAHSRAVHRFTCPKCRHAFSVGGMTQGFGRRSR